MQLCQKVKTTSSAAESEGDQNKTQQVMEGAYNIAIAAKALVTATQSRRQQQRNSND